MKKYLSIVSLGIALGLASSKLFATTRFEELLKGKDLNELSQHCRQASKEYQRKADQDLERPGLLKAVSNAYGQLATAYARPDFSATAHSSTIFTLQANLKRLQDVGSLAPIDTPLKASSAVATFTARPTNTSATQAYSIEEALDTSNIFVRLQYHPNRQHISRRFGPILEIIKDIQVITHKVKGQIPNLLDIGNELKAGKNDLSLSQLRQDIRAFFRTFTDPIQDDTVRAFLQGKMVKYTDQFFINLERQLLPGQDSENLKRLISLAWTTALELHNEGNSYGVQHFRSMIINYHKPHGTYPFEGLLNTVFVDYASMINLASAF